jgi:hypothetical protein
LQPEVRSAVLGTPPKKAVLELGRVLFRYFKRDSDSELTAEQRENLEIVQSSAESLLSIINDVPCFSEFEAKTRSSSRFVLTFGKPWAN